MVETFFGPALSAGAILTGFCGTFLAFRLQREASYYRQVALDFDSRTARDVPIELTHFTAPMLLLLVATALAAVFGFVFPLLALANFGLPFSNPAFTVAGELSSLVILAGYFVGELVHYGIVHRNLANDAREWGKQWPVVAITLVLSGVLGVWIAFFS